MVDRSVVRLVDQIVARYGTVDAFCSRLRRHLDDPTEELFLEVIADHESGSARPGKHRAGDSFLSR